MDTTETLIQILEKSSLNYCLYKHQLFTHTHTHIQLKYLTSSGITMSLSDRGIYVERDNKLHLRPHVSQGQSQNPIWFFYIAFCFYTQIKACFPIAQRRNGGSYGEAARHKRSTENFPRTLLQLVRFHGMTSSLNIPPSKHCPHTAPYSQVRLLPPFEAILLPYYTWTTLIHHFKDLYQLLPPL